MIDAETLPILFYRKLLSPWWGREFVGGSMRKLIVLAASLTLAACAQMGPTKTSADYARERVATAEVAIKSGRYIEALTYLESDLMGMVSNGVEARQMLTNYPSFASGLIGELKAAAQNSSNKSSINLTAAQVERAKISKIASDVELDDILNILDSKAANGNKTDQLDYML